MRELLAVNVLDHKDQIHIVKIKSDTQNNSFLVDSNIAIMQNLRLCFNHLSVILMFLSEGYRAQDEGKE